MSEFIQKNRSQLIGVAFFLILSIGYYKINSFLNDNAEQNAKEETQEKLKEMQEKMDEIARNKQDSTYKANQAISDAKTQKRRDSLDIENKKALILDELERKQAEEDSINLINAPKLINEYLEMELVYDNLGYISVYYVSDDYRRKKYRGYKFFINDVNIKYYENGLYFECISKNCMNLQQVDKYGDISEDMGNKCYFENITSTNCRNISTQFNIYRKLWNKKHSKRLNIEND